MLDPQYDRINNPNSGLIPPAADRTPQFPVMPRLFGASPRTRPIINRDNINPVIGLYGNGELSCCTSTAIANGINGIAALLYPDNTQARPVITTANALYFYSKSTGYDPSVPGSDKGADADAIARYVQQNGYPSEAEYLYPIVGEIDPSSEQNFFDGLDAFGVLNLGVALSINDTKNDILTTGTTPDDKAGSYGYHLLNFWNYAGKGLDDLADVLTFGRKQKATMRWIMERTVLAYGHAYHQLLTPSGHAFDHSGWEDYIQNCKNHSNCM